MKKNLGPVLASGTRPGWRGVPENKLWASRSLPPAAGACFSQFLTLFRFLRCKTYKKSRRRNPHHEKEHLERIKMAPFSGQNSKVEGHFWGVRCKTVGCYNFGVPAPSNFLGSCARRRRDRLQPVPWEQTPG